jgi:nucleoside 2-deoxyribosyltransferase
MKRAAKSIYLIGALANPQIPHFANRLRRAGFDVFDQWWAPGPHADSYLRHYTQIRKLTFRETLRDYAATHVFNFDKTHLDRCDMAVMLMPAGKSGHLELGYTIGKGKPGYILFDKEPHRLDIMLQFATDIFFREVDLFKTLRRSKK